MHVLRKRKAPRYATAGLDKELLPDVNVKRRYSGMGHLFRWRSVITQIVQRHQLRPLFNIDHSRGTNRPFPLEIWQPTDR
jgi:hypothetical protein